jgi:uncharacterized protein YndB with AHSA1/START domain
MERGKAGKETIVVHEVEREIELPAEPDEAWESVVDGEWLGGEAEIDLVPGGDLRIGDREGWVEEVEPGERLSFWWRLPDQEVATRVEITLTETDEGTLIRVVETSPLAMLDLVGIPLPGHGFHGGTGAFGPPLALAYA